MFCVVRTNSTRTSTIIDRDGVSISSSIVSVSAAAMIAGGGLYDAPHDAGISQVLASSSVFSRSSGTLHIVPTRGVSRCRSSSICDDVSVVNIGLVDACRGTVACRRRKGPSSFMWDRIIGMFFVSDAMSSIKSAMLLCCTL